MAAAQAASAVAGGCASETPLTLRRRADVRSPAMGVAGTEGASTGVRPAPRLELVDVACARRGAADLAGASLTADGGEIVGISGDSSDGTAAIVALLAGELAGYQGRVVIDGEVRRLTSPADARRAGISVVHARSQLVPQLSIAHNLMLGQEPRRFGLVDETRLQVVARHHLQRVGIEADLAAPAGDLAPALQQMLEIARSLSRGSRVIVLDEPTAGLAPAERDRLIAWLRTLRRHGVACLYVGHRIDELMAVCDRIAVLRAGRTAQTVGGAPSARPVLGRYVVHDEIAAGGMATVHLGTIRGPFGFTSTVAIKRLHPALAKDPEFVAMFLDEARLASRVRHPNVVPVLDVFAEDGDLSLVMEYVEGESLATLARLCGERGAPVPVAVAIAVSILSGLHAAHEARDEHGAGLGLVHRDVSPHNVLVGSDGVVRLIDFGVAKAAGRRGVSRTGQLKGKIAYMAPEQLQRGNVCRRTDVYAASVLLWELLTGEHLFDGETEGLVLGRVLDDVVPAPSSLRSGLPAGLDAIVLRGLDRNRDRRFASARDMARALEAVVTPAASDDVAQWVQSLAGAQLAARRATLTRLERAAAVEAETDRQLATGSSPAIAIVPAAVSVPPPSALGRAAAALRGLVRRAP
jgi:ABC-type branched-subunit amino acid transport system ATPase component